MPRTVTRLLYVLIHLIMTILWGRNFIMLIWDEETEAILRNIGTGPRVSAVCWYPSIVVAEKILASFFCLFGLASDVHFSAYHWLINENQSAKLLYYLSFFFKLKNTVCFSIPRALFRRAVFFSFYQGLPLHRNKEKWAVDPIIWIIEAKEYKSIVEEKRLSF